MKHTKPIIVLLGIFAVCFLPMANQAQDPVTQVQSSQTIAAGELPTGACVSQHVYNLPGLTNVGRVSAGIFRGAQPLPEGYKTLKAMGIKTIINLRAHHSEKDIVEKSGMRSIEIPINILNKHVDKEAVAKAVSALADPANHPVYLHCMQGQDRTGIVFAVYRMDKESWSLDAAIAEMESFGFNNLWEHMMKFVKNYKKETNQTKR